MFDLEQQISQWRDATSKVMRGQAEAIEELENHLRDAVERSVRAGSTPEQAWESALQRLGTPEPLAAEFRKLAPSSPRSWVPAQVLMAVQGCFALGIAWLCFRVAGRRGDMLLAFHVFCVTVGYSAMFGVGAIVAWSVVSRTLRGWTDREHAALCTTMRWWTMGGLVLTMLGIVLGSVWSRGHWGRFWNWDVKELAAVGQLLWNGLVLAALARRPRDQRVVLLLGLAGNLVVAACWFGPAGLHSDGRAPPGLVVAIAVLMFVELGLVGLTLLPKAWLRRAG
ncbi:MAG TPA: cytochrome c biogenesis protein CcsA [Pirellulales bacterium]|jgi:hypothetical protein|nr:cytochrome c biogenesis protein CcsA [Pirellulales bacterium]HEX4145166.1 cytochrome c biogenesis protein CcsA [Pirellulales bacterium]